MTPLHACGVVPLPCLYGMTRVSALTKVSSRCGRSRRHVMTPGDPGCHGRHDGGATDPQPVAALGAPRECPRARNAGSLAGTWTHAAVILCLLRSECISAPSRSRVGASVRTHVPAQHPVAAGQTGQPVPPVLAVATEAGLYDHNLRVLSRWPEVVVRVGAVEVSGANERISSRLPGGEIPAAPHADGARRRPGLVGAPSIRRVDGASPALDRSGAVARGLADSVVVMRFSNARRSWRGVRV
jgi:hypothetical protein